MHRATYYYSIKNTVQINVNYYKLWKEKNSSLPFTLYVTVMTIRFLCSCYASATDLGAKYLH